MEEFSDCNGNLQDTTRHNRKLLQPHYFEKHKCPHLEVHKRNQVVFNLPDNTTFKKNQRICNFQFLSNSHGIDSYTQTSKTILELAKLETGHLSPDSLTQSPRDFRDLAINTKLIKQDEIDKAFVVYSATTSSSTFEGSADENLNSSVVYNRKHSLNEYINGLGYIKNSYDDEELYPRKSLTEAFLQKKHLNAHVSCSSRSTFLQQTSPLRNLKNKISSLPVIEFKNQFKSKSYIETPHSKCDRNDYELPDHKSHLPVSRFTVKNIKECINDRTNTIQQSDWTQTKAERKRFNNNEPNSEAYMSPGKHKNSRKHSFTFMLPTITSEQKNQKHNLQTISNLVSPLHRGKSLSPNRRLQSTSNKKTYPHAIPYSDDAQNEDVERKKEIQQEKTCVKISPRPVIYPLSTRPKFDEDLLKIDLQSLDIKSSDESLILSTSKSCSNFRILNDNALASTMNHIKNQDWNVALRGLAEMIQLCRTMDYDLLYPHLPTVNQRLLTLLRNPRSHVCRTACQAAGHFFESMKDTRKPEFDDIVEILLCKTADANKFIRKDANLSLDCMVTHIPILHSVRSLCLKGPTHKNSLVRTATVRLIVCAVVITGPDLVLNAQCHEHTRKRIIQNMAKFLQDKNQDTRKYAERLYKVLCRESNFESNLRKYLEKHDISLMKKSLKSRHDKK